VRAAGVQSPRRVIVTDVPVPEPAPHEVRVKMEGAGVCASELPLYEGRAWFEYPRAYGEPGHEGWGRIDAVGEGVTTVRVGERVAVISQRAHAEQDVTDASNVVALPPELDSAYPFPGEPLACAMNAVRRAGVQQGDRIAVVGCGFQGLLLVQLCAGIASEVAAISRRDSSLELAVSLGAGAAWRFDDHALERERFDVVFEATGHQQPLDLAARLTRVRGRLAIVGYHQDGRRSVDMQLWNWRGLDVVNAHERDPALYVAGLRAAVEAVCAGRLDPAPLLTHRYSLEELGEAYRISGERPEGFVKAVWCDG
jgi:threonine dehydrogenase-like Zn-dependent dehydrogenase